MVITHPHQDHYNGLPFIYAHFQPQRLIVNGDNGNEPAYLQFLATVQKKSTPVLIATAGDTLQQDKGLRLECIGMNGLLDQTSGWSTNDRSLVLRLHYGTHSFLFPGDISTLSENKLMLRQGGLPRTDVLLAPHHGSITSAGQDFLAAVAPAMIVVSSSLAGLKTQSTNVHIKAWQQATIPVWVTARQGAITSSSDGTLLRTSTITGEVLFIDENKEGQSVQDR